MPPTFWDEVASVGAAAVALLAIAIRHYGPLLARKAKPLYRRARRPRRGAQSGRSDDQS